jgi:hypothetical protein
MSLIDWRNGGWIRPHKSSPEEVRDLFGIVDRELSDAASTSISADSRHYIAYNGALKLCAVLLYAEGFRPEKGKGSHQLAIDSIATFWVTTDRTTSTTFITAEPSAIRPPMTTPAAFPLRMSRS